SPSEVKLELERIDYWLGLGAQPTETVQRIISQARKSAAQQA
ncbi:MAG: 30S ribosomal protein S16, partial [Deltaproteobacteria bacterium]|nr:30S ribosomal protein S16 [Deltaproteobacteria bacterium]